MEADSISQELRQLALFEAETSRGHLEMIPAVWSATDALTSTEASERGSGLEQLSLLGAARYSPLVVYVLATRLNEPDVALRAQVVKLLAQVLVPDAQGEFAPDAVRRTLSQSLAQMRTRQVFALLQVAEHVQESQAEVVRLLGECTYGGNHLVEILTSRSLALWARKKAIWMCGQVGFLSTLPALERLAGRLEIRLSGQQSMPFLPKDPGDELELLPLLRKAIERLRAP